MADDRLAVPAKSPGDAAHAVTRAGLSVIPLFGGPAVELFQYVLQPPLERRRERWMADVGERLKELERKGLKLESLQGNEQFITAVMHATHIALRTHQAAKLQALQNAIVNSAAGQAPQDTLQHLFLNFVDSLTEQHLRILKVFQLPTPPPSMSTGALGNVLEHNIPELHGRQDLYRQLWKDLFSRGLVSPGSMNVTVSGSELGAKRTSAMGDAFLKFIAEPAR